jgi:hypothetical protein
MMRKYHVRFGGGRMEKEHANDSSPAAYPTVHGPGVVEGDVAAVQAHASQTAGGSGLTKRRGGRRPHEGPPDSPRAPQLRAAGVRVTTACVRT